MKPYSRPARERLPVRQQYLEKDKNFGWSKVHPYYGAQHWKEYTLINFSVTGRSD